MLITRLIAVAATAAVFATPALATGPPSDPGAGHRPAATPVGPSMSPGRADKPSTPGPNAPAGAKAKAYGKLCQGQSKKHVAGEKGTAFSRCVTAMAKVASGATKSPRAACASLSKKHVAGQKGTPFSRCVSAAAKLLND
jgi:hypothetical protein